MTPLLRCAALAALLAATPVVFAQKKGAAPTAEQALSLKPIQPGIEYDRPTAAEAKACTIKAEREGKSTSWVVRDASGRILRRFADANADNVVDTWCYYADGLEVYRDVDSDFDSRADQYRWFHTGGSRWGMDDNEDTKIDRWRRISPQEVAEEVFQAVKAKDAARFERLLLTSAEAKSLGLGKELAAKVAEQRGRAVSDFKTLLRSQKVVDGKSRFVDFGAPRPGVIPAGVDGSTKDVVVYENASALIDTGGTPEQLLLGSLVAVGDGWRLIESPRTGTTGPELANVYSVPTGGGAAVTAPSDKVQAWMSELDKLDRQAMSANAKDRTTITDRRVVLVEKLAENAANAEESEQWYRQLAALLNAAVQSDGYRAGVAKLASLQRSGGVRRLGKNMEAYIAYQRISAEHGLAHRDPKADFLKVQQKWTDDLEAFVKAYPTSPDSADALLQLGSMTGEFAGDTKTAEKWYRQAATEFPRTVPGKTAAGALRRLDSVGKPLPIKGTAMSGKRIDLSAAPYRGRHTLVHYWTTWSSPEGDMAKVAALAKKYRGKFQVIGINLDTDVADAKAFVSKTRTPWEHLYDEAGLDGERATSIGVINLPLMLLVDDRGRVVNRNLHAGELETELQRVIR
ncbi:MAG: thioredoxin-like domain-containing protein [Planctomycetota bacterium]